MWVTSLWDILWNAIVDVYTHCPTCLFGLIALSILMAIAYLRERHKERKGF